MREAVVTRAVVTRVEVTRAVVVEGRCDWFPFLSVSSVGKSIE